MKIVKERQRFLHIQNFIIKTCLQTLLTQSNHGRICRGKHKTCILEMRKTYTILIEEKELGRNPGRPRCRCKYNIKVDIDERSVRTHGL
jgi:hypothetical protein